MNPPRKRPHHWSVSVKQFVEFTRQSGHLASQGTWRAGASEGRAAHQQLQQRRPRHYEAEAAIERVVTTQQPIESEAIRLKLKGRMDGLFPAPYFGPLPIIEEIKTTIQLPESVLCRESHWLQLLCYAWLYLRQNPAHAACLVQLTYYNPELEREKRFQLGCTLALLEPHFAPKLQAYCDWVSAFFKHRLARNRYLKHLPFPFEYERPEQVEIMDAVSEVLKARSSLLLEASTGIGKTAAVTFPALKALTGSLRTRILSLSAKITTQRNTLDFLAQVTGPDKPLKVLQLTAQRRLCPCQPEADQCPLLKDYYRKIQAARQQAFEENWLDANKVASIAQAHALCPYRLQLALLPWMDIVLGDYNYLFDPRVNIVALIEQDLRQTTVLIDECHNLVERTRQMYSCTIKFSQLDLLKHRYFSAPERFEQTIDGFIREAQRLIADDARLPSPALENHCQQLLTQLAYQLRQTPTGLDPAILDIYFSLSFFHRLIKLNTDSIEIVPPESVGDNSRAQTLELFCINTAPLLESLWPRLGGAVLYSGTLQPHQYYRKLLGLEGLPGARTQSHIRQFAEQVQTRILPLDLRFRSRNAQIPVIIDAIARMTQTFAGNHFVFFPSYQFMDSVHSAFTAAHPDIATALQQPRMSLSERDSFLARFAANPDQPLVGFVLLGGVFGEGVDLPGDRLMGVMLLTVGLPVPDAHNRAIEHYFSARDENGFAHAYLYPSLCRTLQASGRLIRTDEDEGLLILADARFAQPVYFDAFSPYGPKRHELAPEEEYI